MISTDDVFFKIEIMFVQSLDAQMPNSSRSEFRFDVVHVILLATPIVIMDGKEKKFPH